MNINGILTVANSFELVQHSSTIGPQKRSLTSGKGNKIDCGNICRKAVARTTAV